MPVSANSSDFLERFNKEEGFDTTGLSEYDIVELLNASENMLFTKTIRATYMILYLIKPFQTVW